jgi:hypothetical protein
MLSPAPLAAKTAPIPHNGAFESNTKSNSWLLIRGKRPVSSAFYLNLQKYEKA